MPDDIVGTIHIHSKYLFGHTSRNVPIYLFHPYDTHLSPMRVGCSSKDGVNKLAVVRWESQEEREIYPRGVVTQILGTAGEYTAEVTALLRHYIPLQKQINKLPQEFIPQTDLTLQDWTTRGFTFNVDPPGCRDVDDCFTIEERPDGTVFFAISIANLLELVPEGSAMDQLAYQQSTTFYTDNGQAVGPMLPRWISEDWGSFLEGSTRAAVSLSMIWDGKSLSDVKFEKTRITNQKTYTYETIVSDTKHAPILRAIASAMKGSPTEDPHEWVEHCMVFYNQRVAELFRTQSRGLLRSLAAVSPSVLEQKAAEYVLPREGATHAAFADTYYTHATSPLRRYADLLAQRTLASLLWNYEPPTFDQTSLDHLNLQMKQATRFERDLFFHGLMTKQPWGQVDAKIVGIKQRENGTWKVYVQVPSWNGRIVSVNVTGDRSEQDPNVFQYTSKDQTETFPLFLTETYTLQYYCDLQQPNWKRRMIFALKKKD